MGYSKQVYARAWQKLDQQAEEARRQNLRRREQAQQQIPQLTEIQREMARSAAGITRSVVTAPDRAGELIDQLARQNLALQEQRRVLLTQHGYPPDYLEERFHCPLCRDKGYVETRMCACLRELLETEAYAQLRTAAPVDQCTFDRFSLDYYRDTPDETGSSPRARMSQVLAFCRRYAEAFDADAESLLLIGRTGLGKTHLSLAIATAVTRRGFGVVYTPVQNLMNALEAGKFSYQDDKKDQYADQLLAAQSCDLLVLDDLGTEFHSQFSVSALYNIINTRQVEGRPTIISTNLEVEEIERRYTQRMLSRLLCVYKTVQFAGQDVRFLMKTGR